jgi:hypothetical protein
MGWRGSRRLSLLDPSRSLTDQVGTAQRDEALAFVDQARALYDAGAARTPASPLLTYYAFLNLGKALVRCRDFTGSLDRARHGLSESHAGPGLSGASVEVHDGGPHVSVFPELIERLGFNRPLPGPVSVTDLAPQVVVGHRLWREASARSERFVVLEDIKRRISADNVRSSRRATLSRAAGRERHRDARHGVPDGTRPFGSGVRSGKPHGGEIPSLNWWEPLIPTAFIE